MGTSERKGERERKIERERERVRERGRATIVGASETERDGEKD